MKLVISLLEVENLVRNHYKLSGSDRIVISRPRKAGDKISTLKPRVSDDVFNFITKVEELINSNNRIGAIREYRVKTMNGLKEAKDCIENWHNITLKEILATGKIPTFINLGP